MKRTIKNLLLTFLAAVAVITAFAFSTFAADEGKWITAWGTGSVNIGLGEYSGITDIFGQLVGDENPLESPMNFRTVITPSASGTKMRVRLSNVYGEEPLRIENCAVARSLSGSRIDVTTNRYVTFNGAPSVVIEPGKEVLSDEVNFNVTAMQNIAISTFVSDVSKVKTMGLTGGESFISLSETDDTLEPAFGIASELDADILKMFESAGFNLDRSISYDMIHVVPILSSVDVYSSNPNSYSVAVIGDATVANNFPVYLGEEINLEDVTDVGVFGKGVIGNCLASDGLGMDSFVESVSVINRLSRDVVNQSGVKYVIVKAGLNDIINPVCQDIKDLYPGIRQPSADELIESFRTFFRICHQNGIKVVVVGITPWKGYTRNFLDTGSKYSRSVQNFEKDWQIALDVNKWLASTNEHDGFVDYTSVSVNPDDPQAFIPEYTLDGAHPTDILQKIWAGNFPLSLIGVGTNVGRVTLDKSSLNLKFGESRTLKATVYPEYALNKNVSWTSSNPSVATVDQKGVVKAVGGGTCEITVVTEDGAKTAKCTVTVSVPVSGVKMNQQEVSIYTTKSTNLSATVLPADATNKTLTWTTSNPYIATVNEKGVVTGTGSGTATVTCKTNDGGFSSTCVVKVLRKVEVENLYINAESKALYIGDTFQLSEGIDPLDATFKDVTWKSDNVKVATVDSNGLVIAVGVGTANIICTSVDNPHVLKKCKITSSIQVKGVALNLSAVSLYETQTKQLVTAITPTNATNKQVVWSSSNPSVATVNNDGVVTAVSNGTAIIRCTTKDSARVATCTVTVLKTIHSKSVSVDSTELTVYDGKSKTLVATIKPSNVSINTVIWSSSNPKIATVDSKGKITGIEPGKCVITCKTRDTGKTAKCKVTVKPTKVKKLAINKTQISVAIDGSYKLSAVITPAYATNQNVKWTSSNKKIAKVNKNGKVTGVSVGTATITCTTVDGNKIATCTVKVKRPKITSLKVDAKELEVGLNGKYTIKVKPVPSTASATKVKYESSDTDIATVSSKGVITGVSEGTVIITVTPNDGGNGKGVLLVVKVVEKPVIGIKLDKTYYNTNVGKSFKLNATVLPTDASNKSISWSSTNTKVATVDKKGNVKAVGKGNCYIRVISNDNGSVSVCHVYVS